MPALDWRSSQARLFQLVTATDRRAGKGAAAVVRTGGTLTPTERVEIYRRMYWARTLDSLWEDFPGVAGLLGQDEFVRVAEAFLQAVGSRSFTLRDLGRGFVPFLRRGLGRRRPDVVAVATYEWAQIEAFDGGAWPPLRPADLRRLQRPAAKLGVQPYLQLWETTYPVGEYVSSLKRDGVLRADASQAYLDRVGRSVAVQAGLRPEARYGLAVHRWEGSLYFKRLTLRELRVLRALRHGKPLADALLQARFPRSLPSAQISATVSEWFRLWTSLGWLATPPRRRRTLL